MPVYEVTYDLHAGTSQEYAALRDGLEKLDSWHDQYSAWFVSFPGSDEALYSVLEPYVGLRDRLTVVPVKQLTTKYKISSYEWLLKHGVQAQT